MRMMMLALAFFLPQMAAAQTEVDPDDLTLVVTLEEMAEPPFEQEMVLVTIHGKYRRHITREQLIEPTFEGLNWMQLGTDTWFDSRVDGVLMRNMIRRMAIFPERSGTITIPPFTHRLTLLDDENKWFEHDIHSAPLTLQVRPAPDTKGWWFPVRRLSIADNWSNTPELLQPGEGVLRVVQVKAVGVSPEMLPPMPALTSPSAMIFPHPEKRLVELSPDGPISIAFWRWTIKPKSPPSTILEPIQFPYFDTSTRSAQVARISPQRVAFDAASLPATPTSVPPPRGRSPETVLRIVGTAAFLLGLTLFAIGRRWHSGQAVMDHITSWRDRGLMHLGTLTGNVSRHRQAAHRLHRRAEPDPARAAMLRALDSTLFDDRHPVADRRIFGMKFNRAFLKRL